MTVVAQLHDHPLVQPDVGLDTTAYSELARQVLQGNVALGPNLYFLSPLYIYFLAFLLLLTDSFTVIRVVQVVAGTGTVALIFLTARHWFGVRAAWVAAALAGATGLLTFYEVLILQAALDAFLTALALWALTIALQTKRIGWYVAAGAVFGIASLNRPNMLLAAGAVLLAMLLLRRGTPALAAAAGLVLALLPIGIRNVVVSGEWTLVSSHGGLNFYIGNNPRATGFYEAVPGITPNILGQQTDARRVAGEALGRTVSDEEASQYFFKEAWRWIRDQPADAAALFLRKFYWTMHAQHIALPYSYPFYAHDAKTALRFLPVGPWLLVPFGIFGLIFGTRRAPRDGYLIWASFVPAYAVAVALFFVAERYRLPLFVPLAIGAGAAIDRLMQWAAARRAAPLAGAVLALSLATFAVTRDHGLDDGRLEEGVRMAERLAIVGRYDEAESWVQRLEAQVPDPARLHYVVGVQYMRAQNLPRAIDHFARADALRSGRVEVLRALAEALAGAGRRDEAVAVLRRITPRAGEDVETWLRLGRLAVELKAPDAGEPFFGFAARQRPASAAARVQYGVNLLVLGRMDDAARELSEAVRLDPRDADALAHLAYAELALGRREAARDHAAAALAIDPAQPLAAQIAARLKEPRPPAPVQ
jgi:tetratricopeptide (TPR) repeat protein